MEKTSITNTISDPVKTQLNQPFDGMTGIHPLDGTYVDLTTECTSPSDASTNNAGYKFISFDKKPQGAHRVAYMVDKKPILPGNVVQHLCNNRVCNNPLHLIQSTQKENMEYSRESGTMCVGSRSPNAKLTEKTAKEVYDLAWNGTLTQTEIGYLYGIAQQQVSDIKLGKEWKHIHP